MLLDLSYNLLNPANLLMTMIICLLLTISSFSLFFLLFSFIKQMRKARAISSMLSIVMSTIVPTFYPYTYLPKSVLLALSIIPSTPAAVLEQGLFNLAPIQWYMLGILVTETIVYFMAAKYLTKWRDT